MEEWTPAKKWNPFNSSKLLAQVYRWRLIKRGQNIPQPALVTVDPINACNLSCKWCNASFILNKRHSIIEKDVLLELADFLKEWRGSTEWQAGVEAVCIAGGGEPLLHPDIGSFIERCVANNIEVGVVTNGTYIDRFLEPLSLCTWVGVSVDAGSARTYFRMKGKDYFDKVCNNISMLHEFISSKPCRLGMNKPGYGISYKYLLYKDNINEVAKGAKIAAEIGCKNFHLRPAGISWDRLKSEDEPFFNENVKNKLAQELEQARKLETESFGVYGITHKFDSNLNKANNFTKCHAIFMTAVFMPPRNDQEKLCLGLCCDRRGDQSLEWSHTINELTEIESFWGSREHWNIFDSINLSQCPRCTYQPHNQIYEHVIENDSMTYKFI